MSDNNDDQWQHFDKQAVENGDKWRHYRYYQPLEIWEASGYFLKEHPSAEQNRKRLHDEFDDQNRTIAMNQAVRDFSWLVDHDTEKVTEFMEDSLLYENWHGDEEDVRMLVEAAEVTNDSHYSVYPDETGDDEDDNRNGAQQTGADGDYNDDPGGTDCTQDTATTTAARHVSEYDERKRAVRSAVTR